MSTKLPAVFAATASDDFPGELISDAQKHDTELLNPRFPETADAYFEKSFLSLRMLL